MEARAGEVWVPADLGQGMPSASRQPCPYTAMRWMTLLVAERGRARFCKSLKTILSEKPSGSQRECPGCAGRPSGALGRGYP